MAHNTRTHADAVWTNGGSGGYLPPTTDYASLDAKVFQNLNGVRGGAYAPSSQIIIGDSAAFATTPGLRVTGPVVVGFGGSLKTRNGARFVLPAVPTYGPEHQARERSLLTSCLRRMSTQPYHWITRPDHGGIQSISCTVNQAFAGGSIEQPSFVLPLRVHDGATLAQATISFRVPSLRLASPIAPPKFRIVRVDVDGNIQPLKKTADGSGFASPTVTSGAGWFNSGNAQHFVYACDQNNLIDATYYYYEAQLIEEVGFVAGSSVSKADGVLFRNRNPNVSVATTPAMLLPNPLTTLPGNIDDVTLAPGMTVLVKDGLQVFTEGNATNGIYEILTVGPVTLRRITTLDPNSVFTPGELIGVEQGTVNGQSVWELTSPVAGLANFTADVTPIKFKRRIPRGNIYHSVLCDFADIPDMRFQ